MQPEPFHNFDKNLVSASTASQECFNNNLITGAETAVELILPCTGCYASTKRFCNRGPVCAWRFYRGQGVLSQQCIHGKNRPISCPENEWCRHQYTFCD